MLFKSFHLLNILGSMGIGPDIVPTNGEPSLAGWLPRECISFNNFNLTRVKQMEMRSHQLDHVGRVLDNGDPLDSTLNRSQHRLGD